MGLWNERVNDPEPKGDLISMLAHNPATRDMPPMEFMGNLVLLIVGGNDTTRNSITGGLKFLHDNPAEMAKLRADPSLIRIGGKRDHPLPDPARAHAPHRARGHHSRRASASTRATRSSCGTFRATADERAIDNPDAFIVDRPRARQHMSFGFGIHRCVGNRLAELQLKILWEEILARFGPHRDRRRARSRAFGLRQGLQVDDGADFGLIFSLLTVQDHPCQRSPTSNTTARRTPSRSPTAVSLMEGALQNNVPGIDGDCGGNAACATCHVYVADGWEAKTGARSEQEEAMLDLASDVRRQQPSRLPDHRQRRSSTG